MPPEAGRLMISEYLTQKAERDALGIPPKPLSPAQTEALADLLLHPGNHDPDLLVDLISHRVPAGVDEAAHIKAGLLSDIAEGRRSSPLISPEQAVLLLSTMGGGYNIGSLIRLLDHKTLAASAARGLSGATLVFDAFDEVFALSKTNPFARRVVEAWADALWFADKPPVPDCLTLTVFKVEGEINTDDFSPAGEAWSRPDIPLHARSMLKNRIPEPVLEIILRLKAKNHPIAFAGDVVGTGSSRKSAANSLIWHIGEDIPFVPNKRRGGVVLGGAIAPIFFNSLEDAGALPIECDVSRLRTGDLIRLFPHEGRMTGLETEAEITRFHLKTDVLMDEVRAGGRIPLIIGRTLTQRARTALGLGPSTIFQCPACQLPKAGGFTLAQKIVGRACDLPGVSPGVYCEPRITTVGSQDTTGPMTRDEIKELACLRFSAPLVMQSFCHTAAYPKAVDIAMQESLHGFIKARGGVALLPGDGIIHAWLNRMTLPDTVGTGGDSHTRFPIGVSFPAGSGLVAFAAALGRMPLDMPESVLVRFKGERQPGITLRDVVNAIPLAAIGQGLLTVAKQGKKNIFSGRIMEIEPWPGMTVEEAFELTNASAERSAAAAVAALPEEAVAAFLKTNIGVLNRLIHEGYGDAKTLGLRVADMEAWLANPVLLRRDPDAAYAAILDIDLSAIGEPVLACPNDPDDVRFLREAAGTPIQEVFIGSCMTGLNHFREAARLIKGRKHLPARLWIAPPTRLDAQALRTEGWFAAFGEAGARIEPPGCSLCMGNQARVGRGTTVMSTSTRNFPHRMGDDTRVFLGSAAMAAVCAVLGRIPTLSEYREMLS